jgi:hypothetical protein
MNKSIVPNSHFPIPYFLIRNIRFSFRFQEMNPQFIILLSSFFISQAPSRSSVVPRNEYSPFLSKMALWELPGYPPDMGVEYPDCLSGVLQLR